MDNIHGLLQDVPVVSRYWTLAIIGASVLVHFKLVFKKKLLFVADQAFSTEPWRLITSFLYFGESLIPVFFAIWNNLKSCTQLETSHSLSKALLPEFTKSFDEEEYLELNRAIQKNQPYDFLWFLVVMASSVIAVTSFGYYQLGFPMPMPGYILYGILNYISCRMMGDNPLLFFGLWVIHAAYAPFLNVLINWIALPTFAAEIKGIISLDLGVIRLALTSPLAWSSFCQLSLGHFWWFVLQFLFEGFYVDGNLERGYLRNRSFKRVQQAKQIDYIDLTKTVLRVILLPPWYWVILHQIRHGVQVHRHNE